MGVGCGNKYCLRPKYWQNRALSRLSSINEIAKRLGLKIISFDEACKILDIKGIAKIVNY
jgi:hypothetical protein